MRTACLVCLQVHIRTSPNASPESVGVFVGSDPTNSPPAEFDIYWFFPAWQLAGFSHTPCLSRVGANEDEMKMTMRWQATKRDTRRGTQKRKEKRQTPAPTHLAQTGQTLKNKGKEKAEERRAKPRPEGGGGWKRRLTQPTRREPNLCRHAQDPNLTKHMGTRMK